jgi:hypothetical protein
MRYLKVRGHEGVLVANPHVDGNPRRYAGQRLVVQDPMPSEHSKRYAPTEEVLRDDAHLRRAAKKGDIDIIAIGSGERVDQVKWLELPGDAPKKEIG